MKLIIRMSLVAILLFVVMSLPALAQTVLPNPVLIFLGQEYYKNNGQNFVRYNYAVFNSEVYPDTLFAAAPSLPPCGTNTRSSRTWVDIFDQRGKRLYGFCAFGKSKDLNGLWFALPEGELPPSWIYIEMYDRQAEKKYKSNLAETTL